MPVVLYGFETWRTEPHGRAVSGNSVLRKKLWHKQDKAEADCKERSGEGLHGLY